MQRRLSQLANLGSDVLCSVSFSRTKETFACFVRTYWHTRNIPFDKARALQALVARLDDEIEAKSMLQSRLAVFEGILFSAAQSSTSVSLSTNLSIDGYDKVNADISRIQMEQIERERSAFEDARKVNNIFSSTMTMHCHQDFLL